MRTLWTKIGLGAVGVFLVGMLLLTVVEDARSTVAGALSHLHHTRSPVREIQADLPFVLGGQRLGTVNHLSIRRASADDLTRFTLTVALDPGADAAGLEACDLVPSNEADFDLEDGFRCAASWESGRSEIGKIVFQPSGLERPILAGGDLASKLHQGDAFSADADLAGSFRLSASDHTGEIVHLKADSSGAMLRVNGKHGRAVVRLQADQRGFYLSVDTSAAH